MNEDCKNSHPLDLFVLIVNSDKSTFASEVLSKVNIRMKHQFWAEGTANSEILDIFGLGGTPKILSVGMCLNSMSKALLKEISAEFGLKHPGRGVAFTVPISGIAGRAMSLFDTETLNHIEEKIDAEVRNLKEEILYTLIVATINQGYSEELMEAARGAGASGGTVWTARKAGLDNNIKFLGITIQEEREVVAILASKEKKIDIMKAINLKCGMSTPAHGIILSVPVEHVEGLAQL